MRKYQYYNTNDDDDRDGYAANWMAQTFTPVSDHIIGKVKLKLFRVGDPGTITVSIKATASGKPVGADLCLGIIEGTDLTEDSNGEWYEISLGDGFDLDIGAQYAIVVRAPDGDASNKVSWRADITDPTYAGGTFTSSSDSGVDWSVVSGVDCMFEEWGVGPASPTTVTWGNLYKSQISAEKIEEAIDRIIQNHEDDPDAHIEVGESLQSHKASAIIDHIVNSIIADKIAVRNVPIEKIDYDHFTLQFNWQTLDSWAQSTNGTGSIATAIGDLNLYSGNDVGHYAKLSAEASKEGSALNYLKNPRIICSVELYPRTNGLAYFLGGNVETNAFGFRQISNKLYACVVLDGSVFAAELLTIPAAWTKYRLEAVYTSGEKIEFYVNGVLEYTKSSDLPEDGADAADEIIWASIQARYNNGDEIEFYVRDLTITQDD